MKKNPNKLFNPLSEHFWDYQYKNNLIYFALIKKIFLQPLVQWFLDIIIFF